MSAHRSAMIPPMPDKTVDELKYGCREAGCLEPPAGIARLCRVEGVRRVWGEWNTYCAKHLEVMAESGDYLVSRDKDRA